MVTSPPRLSISKKIPSRLEAFLDLSSDMAVHEYLFWTGGRRGRGLREVSDEVECGVIMGKTSMGITSMSTWQFTTSCVKCSAQQFNLSLLLCRVLPSLATRVDEVALENFFCKIKSLIKEPPLPCCSTARAWRSASAALPLHQELRAFSAGTLVRFLRWLYSVLRREMSCGGAFLKFHSSWTGCRLHQ